MVQLVHLGILIKWPPDYNGPKKWSICSTLSDKTGWLHMS